MLFYRLALLPENAARGSPRQLHMNLALFFVGFRVLHHVVHGFLPNVAERFTAYVGQSKA